MDNRMIDVAIGLALVFALSSLLTTAVQEVWAQWKGKRGEFLQKALVSFVGDDVDFAKTLMAHPLLVSLSPETVQEQRRPSYIEADSIVTALLGQLVLTHAGGVRPASPLALVDAVHQVATGQLSLKAVGGAAAPQVALPNEALAQSLTALVQGVEQDWPGFETRLAAWWNAVNDRASGWFKRDAQTTIFIFGLAAAAMVNINPIVIGDRLWEDKVLRAEVVSMAQREIQAYNAANASQSSVPAPNPPAPAPAPIASAPVAAKATPPVVATQIDAIADALTAAYRVAVSRAALDALGRASNRLEELAQRAKTASSAAELRPRVQALLDGLPDASEWPAVHAAHQQLLSALALPPAAPEALPAKPATDAGPSATEKLCAIEQDASLRELCQQLKALDKLQQAGLPIGWTAAAWPRKFDQGCNAKPPVACDAWPHPLQLAWWGNLLIALAGWVLTGLACTLGAPFWFDALSKLVRMRATGGRPETTAGATAGGAATTSQLARSPAPAATAPASSPAASVMSDALNDAERALTPLQVQQVQRALVMAEAEVSGWLDGKTRLSIQAWHASRGQNPPSGELSAVDIDELLRQGQGDQGDGYFG